jgi:hypothetical protein
MAAPVEHKVQASTAAAAVSGLALWALGTYVFKGGVPDVVVSWVYVIIPAALAFGAGYWAKHTPRPGEQPKYRLPASGPPVAAAPSGAVQDRPEPSGPPASVPPVTGTPPAQQ